MPAEHATEGDLSGLPCPYCGRVIRDLWDHGIGPESESQSINCDYCDRDIGVEVQTTTRLVARQRDGGKRD